MNNRPNPIIVLTHKCYDIGLCPQTGRYRLYVTGTNVLASSYVYGSPALAVASAAELIRNAEEESKKHE